MDFVLGFDDNYSPFADTTIVSVCVNNSGEHCFYAITDYLSEENRKKLEHDVKRYGSHIEYIYINENDIKDFPIGPHMANNYISIATYFRLFMIDRLPNRVQKVIYLDCDVVVNGSLDLIWNWKFENDHCILAANDEPENARLSVRRLGYDFSYSYFNAGVLMADIVKLRQIIDRNVINNYLKQYGSIIQFHDQDILNALLYDKRDIMPIEYDMLEVYYLKNRFSEDQDFYTKLKNPVIIHYSGPIKPWHIECKHPFKGLFYRYIGLTEYLDYVPQRKYSSMKSRSIFLIKQMVKIIMEIIHVKSYSYISIE